MGARYVHDLDATKDVVHEVFLKLWEKFDQLPEDINYKSYLFRAVRNKCFNHLRDKKQHLQIEDMEVSGGNGDPQNLETKELQREIAFALDLIPEKCREIFRLSREEEMTYGDIAKHLEISIKTVEGQMSKALKILRNHLSEFMSIVAFFLFCT